MRLHSGRAGPHLAKAGEYSPFVRSAQSGFQALRPAGESGDTRQSRNVVVTPDAVMPFGNSSPTLECGVFHDDEPGAAHRTAAKMYQVPVGWVSVFRRGLRQRGESNPVTKRHRANAER